MPRPLACVCAPLFNFMYRVALPRWAQGPILSDKQQVCIAKIPVGLFIGACFSRSPKSLSWEREAEYGVGPVCPHPVLWETPVAFQPDGPLLNKRQYRVRYVVNLGNVLHPRHMPDLHVHGFTYLSGIG